MRLTALLGPCLGIGLLATTGCDPFKEGQYFREGIGTELNGRELPTATGILQQYIGHICKQAGLDLAPNLPAAQCTDYGFGPEHWIRFVKAGMNDIDARCDAYLAWLDNRRRSRDPFLQQISDMSKAAGAILDVTGVGVHQITIVGQAFGLASNTFTNVNSRLLLEANQSTVQAVVVKNQEDFRNERKYENTDNRSDAIYYLRSYLRLCMPVTIETEINTTVSISKRVGPEVLINRPFIAPAEPPILARDEIRAPGPRRFAPGEAYKDILEGDLKDHTDTSVLRALKALCIPDTEVSSVTAKTTALIHIFESAYHREEGVPERNGRLDKIEVGHLNKIGPCSVKAFRNYYEKAQYQRNINPAAALNALRRTLRANPKGLSVKDTDNLEAMRSAIKEVKRDVGFKESVPDLADQVTPEFIDCLMGAIRPCHP